MSVFVTDVSFPFDWIRQPIVDRSAQVSGIPLEAPRARIRTLGNRGSVVRAALAATRPVREVEPVEQSLLETPFGTASDAASEEIARSEENRRFLDQGISTNSTGMWQRA